MSKHVAVLMGGWSAEREVSLRSGKACADALERQGYRVTRVDVGRDIATVLQRDQARRRAQRAARPAGRGRHAAGHPGNPRRSPTRHSGVLASALAMQKDIAKVLMRAAGVPVPEGMVASRFEAAKTHLLPPPYVIKPIAEGSSVGVFIVTEEHAHPPQELTRDGLGLWRAADRRKLHSRQGVDLRRHGRPGARRDRDRADGAVLRLRGEIRARAGRNICFRRQFHHLFTKRSED